MRLGQTSALYTVSRIVASLIGFLATVYFAKVLGAPVLGQYALVLAIVTWVSIVARSGIASATTKRISEGEERHEYFGAALVVGAVVATLAGSGVLLLSTHVNAYVGTGAATFVALILIFHILVAIVTAALTGSHKVHIYSLLQVGGRIARSLGQVTLVLIGWGLTGMLVGYVIGSVITGVVALWSMGFLPARPDVRHFRSLFEFAKFSWLGKLSQRFYGTLDVTVLGLFVSSGLVGVYSVTWSVVMFLAIFGTGIRTTLFPELSKLSADGSVDEVADLTRTAIVYSGLILVPGLVGGVLIGDRILLIYGPAFVKGDEVLGILVLAALVWTYSKQFHTTLDALDRPDLTFRANGVFVVLNTVLNVTLIYWYGILGAALATLLSAAVAFLLSFIYVRGQLDVPFPLSDITRQWVAALVMGVVVYGARGVLEETTSNARNVALVAVLVTLGAGVYFTTLLAISTDFRDTVARNLPYVPHAGK